MMSLKLSHKKKIFVDSPPFIHERVFSDILFPSYMNFHKYGTCVLWVVRAIRIKPPSPPLSSYHPYSPFVRRYKFLLLCGDNPSHPVLRLSYIIFIRRESKNVLVEQKLPNDRTHAAIGMPHPPPPPTTSLLHFYAQY